MKCPVDSASEFCGSTHKDAGRAITQRREEGSHAKTQRRKSLRKEQPISRGEKLKFYLRECAIGLRMRLGHIARWIARRIGSNCVYSAGVGREARQEFK